MKIIPTFIHGVLDYIGGIVLLLLPNLFGFADVGGAAVWVPRIIGIIGLVQSLMTRYELGIAKVLPMRMHLMNDYITSLLLALSPWLFGFNVMPANVWMPHVVLGVFYLVASFMTEREPRRLAAAAR